MRLKIVWPAAFALAGTLLIVDNAAAQQTFNFTLGYFQLRGEDSRSDDDVILENLPIYGPASEERPLEVGDFNGPSIGAEWLVPIGDYLEAGAGIQFSTRTVETVYEDFTRPNGDEIEQEFNLRIVPISATLRVLPLGRNAVVQPYVGAGVGFFNWRYAEVGDFIDFTQAGRPIFAATYEETGWSVGPVAVFGLRVPLDRFSIGGEVRWQKAEGDLDTNDFLAPKIDLGGFHYQATLGFRF
jgi:hypothetical protein